MSTRIVFLTCYRYMTKLWCHHISYIRISAARSSFAERDFGEPGPILDSFFRHKDHASRRGDSLDQEHRGQLSARRIDLEDLDVVGVLVRSEQPFARRIDREVARHLSAG